MTSNTTPVVRSEQLANDEKLVECVPLRGKAQRDDQPVLMVHHAIVDQSIGHTSLVWVVM